MTLSSASFFNSCNTGNGCCIARIIRRILCISNLPKCPFDHIKEEVNDSSLQDATATPGLVARLMGLDSLPPVETKQSSPFNHVDSHRKSRSLRAPKIIPTYQELEDENFFILSFDHVDLQAINSKKRRRRRDSNKENRGINERNSKDSGRGSDSEMEIGEIRKKISSYVIRPLKNSRQNSNGAGKMMKAGKEDNLAVIRLKTEGDSENSSPNSVLEFHEFPLDREAASSGDISWPENSKLRTLSDQLGDFGKSKEISLIRDGCGDQQKHTKLRNGDPNYNAENWDEISKLAAREVMKSSWFDSETSKNHHSKEIGKDLAFEILDQLLSELLVE